MTCIFCQIIQGQAPASLVHHDDQCCVFLDLRPINPGHLLVVPRRHATGLADLPPEDGATLFRVAQRYAGILRHTAGLRCEGVNLLLADGAPAGQEVFHIHLHVVPRFQGDGFGFRHAAGWKRAERPSLDAVADAIRGATTGLHGTNG